MATREWVAAIALASLGLTSALLLLSDRWRAGPPEPSGGAEVDCMVNPCDAMATSTAPAPSLASAACPSTPACPAVDCEPTIVTVIRSSEPELLDTDSATAAASVLAEALKGADVRASYDLDCTAYPCLAVFSDEVPDLADRTEVFQQLAAAMPTGRLVSSTLIAADGSVAWVLVLADETPPDQAQVDARIDELLPSPE